MEHNIWVRAGTVIQFNKYLKLEQILDGPCLVGITGLNSLFQTNVRSEGVLFLLNQGSSWQKWMLQGRWAQRRPKSTVFQVHQGWPSFQGKQNNHLSVSIMLSESRTKASVQSQEYNNIGYVFWACFQNTLNMNFHWLTHMLFLSTPSSYLYNGCHFCDYGIQ